MRINNGRSHFYQWDLNQRLIGDGLEVGDEVHFANALSTEAQVVRAYAQEDGTVVADVPNKLLQASCPIVAYRYIRTGDSEHTVETTTFTVQKRPKPSDYIYTETEVKSYEQLAEKVKEALKKLEGFEGGTQVTIEGESVSTFPVDTYVQEQLDTLKARLDAENAARFEGLEKGQTETSEELAKHEEAVARQDAANREAFGAIDSAMEALGEEVKDIEVSVKHFDTDVQNLDTAVTNLDTKVTNLDTEVTNLETKVTNLDTAVANFGTLVADNNKKVVNLEAEVEAAQKALDEADDAIRDDFAKADTDVLEESKAYTDEKNAEMNESLAGKSAVKVGGQVVQDFDADTKAEKISGAYKVPCTDGNGNQISYGYSQSPNGYTFALRRESGAIDVGRATKDVEAVPLAQMNEALAEKADNDGTREWLEILTKRVTNIEDGTAADAFIVDDSTAYIKNIPSDAASYAELRAVGGMTHKVPVLSDENLFVSDALNDEYGGQLYWPAADTVSVNFGQFYHYNEVSTSLPTSTFFPNAQAGKTYVFSYKSSHPQEQMILYGVTSGQPFTMTEEILNGYITFRGQEADENWEYVDGYFYDISLVEVTDVLIDTPVTALDITGKNLYNGGFGGTPFATEENGVLTLTKTEKGERWSAYWYPPFPMVECRIEATPIANSLSGSEVLQAEILYDNDAVFYAALLGASGSKASYNVSARADRAKIKRVTLFFHSSVAAGASVKLKDIMIMPTVAPTNTTYSPYHKTTFAIPAEVQALDGYGWGIPNGAVNGIEWNEGGAAYYVKRVERRVYNGTERWSGDYTPYFYVSCEETYTGAKVGAKGVCNKANWRSPSPCVYTSDQAHRMMSAQPSPLASTIEEWRTLVSQWYAEGNPLTVYYELAEPIVTDVSAYFTEDNLIAVEGGGTITAVNENNLAAPSTIIYGKRGF